MTEMINNKQYDIGKLDARQQFHLVRKLAPIFATIQPPANGKREPGKVFLEISQKLCDMKQDDVDYIITLCMSVVKRQEGASWAHVQAPGTDRLMFGDIDLDALIVLTMKTIEENLGNFLTSPLLASSGEAADAK